MFCAHKFFFFFPLNVILNSVLCIKHLNKVTLCDEGVKGFQRATLLKIASMKNKAL